MKVFHVQGKKLVEIQPPYEFLNGDVYLIDNSDVSPGLKKKVFIWLGSQAYADDRAVGAWAAKQLDLKDKEIDIDTEVEGQESDEFKGLVNFTVITGDTPGFLKHIEIKDNVSYALYRVRDIDLTDGSSSDDIVIENVPLKRESFKSEDVFVLDAYQDLYVWIGASSQVGEKAAGNRLVRKLDVDRARNPMVYNIGEGYEPEGFWDMVEKLAKSGKIRTDDAGSISKEMTGGIADLKSVSPPEELPGPPVASTEGVPKETPPPVSPPSELKQPPEHVDIPKLPKTEPTPEPTFVESSTITPTRPSKIIKLYFVEGEFTEKGGNEDAILEIDEANRKATLTFMEGTGLIAQRTAGRQARGICKAGFQLSAGYRVGLNCVLTEVKGERSIDDRLLQEGHKYR
ncbi:MAG: hypothetical protein ACTSW1_08560 [Candidatus Hodarchaeales archaeon]